MQKVVLDIGNCGPDHAAIASAFQQWFRAEVLQADQWSDARALLLTRQIDLVLVNRKLDIDYSDGIEIIRAMKADPQFRAVPVMLVTNYAEHQQAAVAIGAEVGFGKLELRSPETKSRLERILCASVAGGGS
jgi:two-component system chemotaxis response regulator CheY